ncbi:MAG: ATP-binding protein [Nitrospirota bacterium]|nr:ATP-binding protein [Nitrospirota bacterium]
MEPSLLAQFSHELRTPLLTMLGFGELLGRQFPPGSEQRDYTDHIGGAGRYVLQLLDDLLEAARLDAGQVRPQVADVELSSLVAECVGMLTPEASTAGVWLYSRAPEGRSMVRADRRHLKQVLLNLLVNAIKYNRKNGSVTISWQAQPEGSLRLSVTDTGIGLDAQRAREVFAPFNRLPGANRVAAGTGIGLYVAWKLVRAMHGDIQVDSTPGRGATFHVLLPGVAQAASGAA